MAQIVRPRLSGPYRPGLWERMAEGLRYGGGIGQWSWLFHRLTGVGVLVFLVVHILDTFFVVAYPGLYDHTLSLYSGRIPWMADAQGQPAYYWSVRWLFRLSELALIACVLFHTINGVRIVLFDFWPGASRHQRTIFRVVMGVFLAAMAVVSYFVFRPLTETPQPWKLVVEGYESGAAPAPAPGPGGGGQR